MSYIIAFVAFAESDKEFPVQCFRTDLELNDEVVVRRVDGKLKTATICQLQYLNWDCEGRIECKKAESSIDSDENIILPKGSPLNIGISTPDAFIKVLRDNGWISVKSRQRMYRTVLANVNVANVAYIFVRKNGLDIQIIPRSDNERVAPNSLYKNSLTEGKVVRHSLAHTTFNLFEGVLRFSISFLNNESDLERYFSRQGSSDRRTDELKEQSRYRKTTGNEMSDLYSACSDGSGEPAYLGDGVWITSGGGLHDWGR